MLKFIVLLVLLCVAPVVLAAEGRCVEFVEFSVDMEFTGLTRSLCADVLPYDNIWIDQSYIDMLGSVKAQNETCVQHSQFLPDSILRSITASFTDDSPSQVCQRVLLASLCTRLFPECDPTAADPQPSSAIPCKYLCDNLSGLDDSSCSSDDVAILQQIAALSTRISDSSLLSSIENCDDATLWSQDDSCVAPDAIPAHVPADRCESYTGTFCSEVYASGTNVYLAGFTQQDDLENYLMLRRYEFNMLPDNGLCSQQLTRMWCQETFPECLTGKTLSKVVDSSGSFVSNAQHPVPLLPPTSVCSDVQSACQDTAYFILAYDNKLNCDMELLGQDQCLNATGAQNFLGTTDYEQMTWSMLNGQAITAYSFAASASYSVSTINTVDCPDPLVLPSDPTNSIRIYNGRCAIPCPAPMFSHYDYTVIHRLAEVFSGVTIVLLTLLTVTFLVFKSQRSKHVIIFFTISYTIMLIMLFIGSAVLSAHQGAECRNNTTLAHMWGFGLFQAMFLIYFLIAACCWWMMQAVEIFEKLILGRHLRSGSAKSIIHTVSMHCFCWGFPLFCVIGLIVGGQLGYDPYMSWAWVTQDPVVHTKPINLEWPFLYVPLIAFLAVSAVLVGIILYALLRFNDSKQVQKFHTRLEQQAGCFDKCQAAVRVLGFLFVLFYLLIILIAVRGHMFHASSSWTDSLSAWGRCKVAQGDDCTIQHRLNPGVIGFLNVSFSVPGLIMFCLYFSRSDLWGLWCGVFYYQLGWSCFSSCAREDVDTDSGTESTDKGSTGTKDLLTGAVLTTNSNSQDVGSSASNGRDKGDLLNGYQAPLSRASSVHNQSDKQKAQHRQQLFKGFQANRATVGGSRSHAPSSSPYIGHSTTYMSGRNSVGGGHGVELGRFESSENNEPMHAIDNPHEIAGYPSDDRYGNSFNGNSFNGNSYNTQPPNLMAQMSGDSGLASAPIFQNNPSESTQLSTLPLRDQQSSSAMQDPAAASYDSNATPTNY